MARVRAAGLAAVSCTVAVLPALTRPEVLLRLPPLVSVALVVVRIAPLSLLMAPAVMATLLPSSPKLAPRVLLLMTLPALSVAVAALRSRPPALLMAPVPVLMPASPRAWTCPPRLSKAVLLKLSEDSPTIWPAAVLLTAAVVALSAPLAPIKPGRVVEFAGGQRHHALRGDAARAAGVGRRIGVGERLAVGVDAQRSAGLDQAGVVVERAGLQRGALRGGDGAEGVVEVLAAGVDGDVAAGDAACRGLARGLGVAEAGVGQGDVAGGFDAAAVVGGGARGGDAGVVLHGGDNAAGVVNTGCREVWPRRWRRAGPGRW